MFKKLQRMVILVTVISLMCSMPTMAKTRGRQLISLPENEESILLPETVISSTGKDMVVGRSKALASALCKITNTEKGIIHIYAETAMFIPVDWAGLTVYLEKLDESTKKWLVVETFEKECYYMPIVKFDTRNVTKIVQMIQRINPELLIRVSSREYRTLRMASK